MSTGCPASSNRTGSYLVVRVAPGSAFSVLGVAASEVPDDVRERPRGSGGRRAPRRRGTAPGGRP